MSMMERLKKESAPRPPIMTVYGRPGVGKTYFAAHAPGAVFIQTEDGLTSPQLSKVPTFGVLKSAEEVKEAFGAVAEHHAKQGWRTVVLDSLDALAPMIVKQTCDENGWAKLEDGSYGKGKTAYVDAWAGFIEIIRWLRNEIGVGVIMIGHHKAIKLAPPDSEPYTQYSLTLHEDVTRLIVAHSDAVLFATYPAHVVSTDQGFGKKAARAITDKPCFFTMESGARVAKNRYDMPEKLPLDFDAVAKYVPTWNVQTEAAE